MKRTFCPVIIGFIGTSVSVLHIRKYTLKPGRSLTQESWEEVMGVLKPYNFRELRLNDNLRTLQVTVPDFVDWETGSHRFGPYRLNLGQLVWHAIADQLDAAKARQAA